MTSARAVLAITLAFGGTTIDAWQQSAEPRRPQLDLVEVVGCLSTIAADTWVLNRGGEPVASPVPWTTAAAVQQAAARPLGARRFRLIGVSPFKPVERAGQKVVVKGVLIPDGEPRINVTSLQTARDACVS